VVSALASSLLPAVSSIISPIARVCSERRRRDLSLTELQLHDLLATGATRELRDAEECKRTADDRAGHRAGHRDGRSCDDPNT
jgi:hypothetical protein